MDNIETGQLYEAERQIKIVRTDPVEMPEPAVDVQMKGPSDLDEPEGTIQAPGVTPAPAGQTFGPAWNEMKAGYRYAAGHWRPKA
jgi:hypothetical protein